jgi:hypothetical protein
MFKIELPIRLFVSYTAANQSSLNDVVTGNGTAGRNEPAQKRRRNAIAESSAPANEYKHAELIAFCRDDQKEVRCICVFGKPDDVGCVFESPSISATHFRGCVSDNSNVYFDTDMVQSLDLIYAQLINHRNLPVPNDLKPLFARDTKTFSKFVNSTSAAWRVAQRDRDARRERVGGPVLRLPLESATVLADALVAYEAGVCRSCRGPTNGEELRVVCCDGCSSEFHFRCLTPPISSIDQLPSGDWFCVFCAPKHHSKAHKVAATNGAPTVSSSGLNSKNAVKSSSSNSAAGTISVTSDPAEMSSRLLSTLSRAAVHYGDAVAANKRDFQKHLQEHPVDAANFAIPSPYWWQQAPSSFILTAVHNAPPPEWLRLQELPGPSYFKSMYQFLQTFGATEYVAVSDLISIYSAKKMIVFFGSVLRYTPGFEKLGIRVCDLWALTEADYIRLLPKLGPRRRIQAYTCLSFRST